MHGPDGNIVNKLTWKEYAEWQRWDEWPEMSNNPPLTVETSFWYQNQLYMVTEYKDVYAIVKQPEFTEIISNENFLDLLTMPFIEGKTFKQLMPEFLFEI